MKDSQIRDLDMGKRVRAVAVSRPADFPAGSRQAELITALNLFIIEVEQQAARQAAAILDGQESVEEKRVAIKSLLSLLRAINQTARSINELFPGIADQFRMPHDTVQDILNRARAVIIAATPIAVEFTRRGLPDTFLDDLQIAINAVEAADTHKANALATQTAATAAIAAALKQLLTTVRELNAIMRNLYRQDPGSLAAWTSASHIEKAPKRASKKALKEAPEIPAPPPSTPST